MPLSVRNFADQPPFSGIPGNSCGDVRICEEPYSDHRSGSTSATAVTAMPSPRPVNPSPSVVVADTRAATRAIESCEQKAIEQAKYPGGAKIISTDVGELTTLPNGNKTLPVEGEIDMPNAFGTPVRHTYWCGLMMILEDGTIINDEPLVLPKN